MTDDGPRSGHGPRFTSGGGGTGNEVGIVVTAADRASKVFVGVVSRIGSALKSVSQLGLKAGAALTTAVSAGAAAAPAFAQVANAVRVMGGAAPMLAAFAAAGKIVQGTLKLIFAEGSAARNALQPFADTVTAAGTKASEAAAKGIRPLAESLSRAVRPDVEKMMVRIGEAANRVQREFFGWAKSTQGLHAIHNILSPIGDAAQKLAPSISRVAVAFTGMLGRIMAVSMNAGTSGLTGILDRLAEKFDKINALTVAAGLDKLKSVVERVRSAFQTLTEWVERAVGLYRRYQTEFGALADAFSIAAIAFGGPIGVIIGSVGLLIRHFDDLKAAYQRVRDYFTTTPEGMGIVEDLKATATTVQDTVVAAFEALGRVIRDKVLPFVRDHLAPAFRDIFLPAVREVATFIKDTVIPNVERFANLFFDRLAPAFDRVVGAIRENKGELSALWDVVKRVGEVVLSFATSVLAAQLVAALEAASRAIAFMITNLGNLIRAAPQTAAAVLTMAANVIGGLRTMVDTAIGAVQGIIGAFARLPGPLGAPFRAAQGEIGAFRERVNRDMASAESRVRGAAAGINNWLAGIRDKNVTVTVTQRYQSVGRIDAAGRGVGHRATGGVVGAAAGGARGSWTVVGEMGREVVRLPYGSRVEPHGQSERTIARASGGRGAPARVVLELRSSGRRFDDLLLETLRHSIRVQGGDVQAVLGG